MNSNFLTPERIERSVQQRINPIRNLSPERLSLALDQFDLGYFQEFSVLSEKIARRDPIIKSVLGKREKSVARQSFEIITEDESPRAEAHKEALKFFYNNLTVTSALEQNERGGLSLLLRQMLRAHPFKYAVHEIVWQPKNLSTQITRSATVKGSGVMPANLASLLTAQFIHCPLQFFEGRKGKLRFLQQDFAIDGIEMKDGEWLVTVGDSIMESLAIAYMFKWMSLKDWVNFNERFGFPIPIGKTTATKDSPQWNAMKEAVRGIASDGGAVINQNELLELLEVKNTASSLPFPPLVEYMDRVIAILARGGDLSTISKADSVGASVQDSESDLLTEDDCQFATENLNAQVDPFVTDYLFGEAPLAYIKINPPKKQNVDQEIKINEHLVKNGAKLSLKNEAERFSRELAEDDELVLSPGQTASAELPAPTALENESAATSIDQVSQAAAEMALRAKIADMQPFVDRIIGILELPTIESVQVAMKKLKADYPDYLKRIQETARLYEGTQTAALFNGMALAEVSTKPNS